METEDKRSKVRGYSLIPKIFLRLIPQKKLEEMYEKSLEFATDIYEAPIMGGKYIDENQIIRATVNIEAEIKRRGLEKKALNPNEQKPNYIAPVVFATDVYSNYLK